MSRRKRTVKASLALLGAALAVAAWLSIVASATAAAPQWSLSLSAFPSSFASGATGSASEGPGYRIVATNKGDGPTTAPYAITDVLPPDLAVGAGVKGEVEFRTENSEGEIKLEREALSCVTSGQEVTCTGTRAIKPGLAAEVIIPLDVASGTAGKSILDEASVEGGGAVLAKATLRTAVGLPAWRLAGMSIPTYVEAGSGKGQISLRALNVGGAVTHGTVTLIDTLPAGLTPTKITQGTCSIAAQVVTCTIGKPLAPGELTPITINVQTDPLASGTLFNEATIEGGGAAPAATTTPVTISPTIAPFGFLDGETGFAAPLSSADGAAATQAGSHPHQLSIEMSFPSEKPTERTVDVLAAGAVRDITTDLPPGEIVNPNSTSKLCTEVQLVARKCPDGSQIGTALVTTNFRESVGIGLSAIYNMVAAPGTPSTFGFDAAGVGIFVHIAGALRSDSDYGLSGASTEILGRGPNPLMGVQLSLWSDPSNSSHDRVRGGCLGTSEKACPAEEETKTALLTAPVQCTGQPTVTGARADSWQETGAFKSASYESADLAGTPVAVNGCNQLQFEPSIEAKPTTNLADSPSGLDVTVHQPTNEDPGGVSPGVMKDLRLVLPEGMSVNPSSADGLAACTEAQAHYHTLTAGACPDDSKLGSVEVRTPLLDHPVEGALYLAEPFHNPVGSLIALYLELNDPSTGTVSNLVGKVEPDPRSGQLTTVFEQNPQLPIEDIESHLFTGPRAALRTPAACGTYESKADITPWSAPQTPVAHVGDPFAIGTNPNGGACPARGEALPTSSSFTAGTLSPQAGEYSPFVLKLTRPDDTQEPQRIDTVLPPGLVAKLAGVPYCPEAGIARAISRSNPNGGILERNDPSCPAASRVGTVDVGAGAGITPLHTQGNAYLAGPYEGAPLSLVVVTPAIAGPFDLGAVVVRTALQVDPETAKVTATSDPLPRILYGIPLDIRSIAIELDRSQFILNPTSCDPMRIAGALTTTAGQASPLSAPFQVGGCNALAFDPKLALHLKGGTRRGAHPALRATLTFPGKGRFANVRRAEVTLPHSEFLDQAHIGTVCTRVQFAAEQCPAASVYGKATAITPLLDGPLSGPVYLRSSSHELPDLVVALHGQVDVVLDGRIDSVHGGIRNTFEAAPDAPVSKFTLQMQGGKKGLLVNSTNLCRHPKANRATVLMEGQNGKVYDTAPALANSCKKALRRRKHSKHAR